MGFTQTAPHVGTETSHTRPMSIERLFSLREVIAITSLSKNTIYRRVAAGRFPRPMQISPGRVAWRYSDLGRWQASVSKQEADSGSCGGSA